MQSLLYSIDEIGKDVLQGLHRSGRSKTFAQILQEAGHTFDNSKQVELATSLEALGLIQAVTYKLPLEIRAELSPTGEKIALPKPTRRKKPMPAAQVAHTRKSPSSFRST